MPRANSGPRTKARRKKILKLAKGYQGARSKLFRTAKNQVFRSLAYAYRDRRVRRRQFRRLWITRISAAARQNGLRYSELIAALDAKGIELNRKSLADIALHDPAAFTEIVTTAKAG